MKLIVGLFTVLIAIIIAVAISQGYLNPFGQNATVTIGKQTFKAEIAKSDKDKQTGLSNKTSLPQDQGMLFPFAKPDYYSFWMKEMKFPIDIIYIKENKIVTIFSNVPVPASKDENPAIYKPEEPADTVFEINAGLSQKNNFQKGDAVTIKK